MNRLPDQLIRQYQEDLRQYCLRNENKLLNEITNTKRLTDHIKNGLEQVINKFTDQWIFDKGLIL